MLNELAIELHHRLMNANTEVQNFLSVDLHQATSNPSKLTSLTHECWDLMTADDPTWMVPPPIPTYGSK